MILRKNRNPADKAAKKVETKHKICSHKKKRKALFKAGLYFCGIVVFMVLCFFLDGCYLIREGTAFFRYTAKGIPNQRLLNDPDLPPDTREFLLLITDINEFAVKKLGLKSNKNYTRYIDIDRNYLVYVVSATEPYSFKMYQWSYPVLGSMPYKGFFERYRADREAETLRKKGYEVWVRPVGAFSSLGYFRDPLYSYMKNYSVYRLANIIIHEQAHATLFLRGEAEFNEQFATFVGDEGARLFVKDKFGADTPEYRFYWKPQKDLQTFRELILALRHDLEGLYNIHLTEKLPQTEIDKKKQAIITEHQAYMDAHYDELFLTDAYRGFPELPINNAYISMFSLYTQDISLFYAVYGLFEYDMPQVVEFLMELEHNGLNPLDHMQGAF